MAAAGIGYGTAVAGAAAGAGMGLFSYNRGNYQMDQKMHYTKYTASIGLACAQTGMYRQDVADLVSLTVTRVHCYIETAGMTATILTAIYCPGRVGLHTPAPPGWLMGLMFLNIAGTYLWLGMVIWLGMHASLRANSAGTHMLTRFVRLPIPGTYMLDRARKFLSSWEEQPFSEVFRLPFTRHQHKSSTNEGGFNEDMDVDPDAERRTRHGYDVPAWYRKEKSVDGGYTMESMLSQQAQGSNVPEHMQVFREIQNEWWPYDVYCRLSLFLAFMHLIHCWTYLQIAHHLTELRSVFSIGCIVLPMCVLHQIILTLDVIPSKGEFPIHRLGPMAPWFAYIAAAIEYKRWWTPGAMTFGFICVYIAYIIHVVYTIALIRLCSPDLTKPPVPADVPGGWWWPGSWHLPSAFQHAIWIVAPPSKLEPGQNDLVGEIRAASSATGSPASMGGLSADKLVSLSEKRKDVHRALGPQDESPAWFSVKVGLISLLIAWIFLIIGFTVEVANQGTMHPSLINAPGMPNNARDPRYRPTKIGGHEPTEVGTGGDTAGPAKGMSQHSVARRLQALGLTSGLNFGGQANATRQEVADKLRNLLPYLIEIEAGHLGDLGMAMSQAQRAAPVPEALPAATVPARASVQWPPFFEPRLLASGPASKVQGRGMVAVTLSRHGRGVVITAPESSGAAEVATELTPFVLQGIATLGPLLAASWDEAGLLLTAASGAIAECPGSGPSEGLWHCKPHLGAKLPIGVGGKPFSGSIAVGRHPKEAALRAAVIFPGESTVTIFSQASAPSSPWLLAGEVRTGMLPTAASFATMGDVLLLASADGSVSKMQMGDGSVTAAAKAIPGLSEHLFLGSCDLPDGKIARLSLNQGAEAMQPTLFLA